MNMQTTPITSSMIQSDIKMNQEKEIKEAIAAADNSLKHLNNAITFINKASSVGCFDTMCGGGCLSSIVKHDYIDKATFEIKLANDAAKKLNEELKDVQEIAPIKISDTTMALDIFFDNIFSDMKVQSKLTDSEMKLKRSRRDLEALRKSLNERLEECQNPSSNPQSEMKEPEKKIEVDQEKAINEAFEASNVAMDDLKKALRYVNKAKDLVGEGAMCLGPVIYVFSENTVLKAKDKVRNASKSLKKLDKKLEVVQGIDSSMTSEFLNFQNISQDILECKNIMFDNSGIFNQAKKSCLIVISQVEAIRNDLKDRLAKYQTVY